MGQLAEVICGARAVVPPERQRIALAIYRLLAEGDPLPPTAAAARLGVTDGELDQAMTTWPAALRDERGRLVGYGGLSLSETAHRFEVDGRRLYTWCAWDTLFLPELLDTGAHVRSHCAATGEPIELAVSAAGVERVAPAATVVSMIVPREPFGADVVDTFCCHVRFFQSEDAAQPWLKEHDGGFVLTVADAFELGRHANHLVFGDALA
jgi:alkylmercury lyase